MVLKIHLLILQKKNTVMCMTKTSRLALFREIFAVYCENHNESHKNHCGQNAELLNIVAGGTYS
jgi:hypothetical protein